MKVGFGFDSMLSISHLEISIGWQFPVYTVSEGDNSTTVCVQLIGEIGRSGVFTFETIDDSTAQG